MKPALFLFLFLFLLLLSTATSAVTSAPKATPAPKTTHPAVSPAQSPTSSPTPPTTVTGSKLDPEQVRALQSLNIPTARDPCIQPSPHNATVCDVSGPYRHLVALRLSNCSTDTSLSSAALKSLSTLRSLSFSDCPVAPVHFPSDLALSLTSLSCVRSLRRLSGIWLSRFENLTDLTVSGTPINTRGIFVILGNMKKLTSLTLSHANLTGSLPKYLHQNLTHIDFSDNNLKGTIPTSVTLLESLQSLNLSSNGLIGEMPTGVGNLISLKNLSLASNSFSGSIPDSISSIPGLVHLDLSGNQLNGTVPGFFSKLKSLKVLNLENNQLHGVLPFNASFINRLVVFKVGGNSNLCYNHTVLSSKMKLRIARCDKHGLPVSPPPAKESPSGDSQGDYTDSEADSSSTKGGHHGPNKVVMGVAIALSSIVFLIILLVLMAKCCG